MGVQILARTALVLFLAGVSMTTALYAQGGGGSGTGQYCAIFSDGTSPDCSFTTFQECDQSISGIGGICDVNPSAGNQASPSPPQGPFWSDPAAVPPPPIAGQPSPPLPLPDAVAPDNY